ncbi:MAG: APC family permease [Acidobacteria bacterium]|nr:APC family permease [Acidobacteriota bacterium]
MAPVTPTNRATLVRVVSRWDLTCLAINMMVGSSVFVLPGIVLKDMGGWAPLAVLAAGLGVLCILLSFAEAAGRYREPGGPYRYAGDAFGEYAGVQLGLLYWVAKLPLNRQVTRRLQIQTRAVDDRTGRPPRPGARSPRQGAGACRLRFRRRTSRPAAQCAEEGSG